MTQITRTISKLILLAALPLTVGAQQQVHKLGSAAGPDGYAIQKADEHSIIMTYRMNQFSTVPITVNGEQFMNLAVSGMLLQNEQGYPDLPQNGRYIAVPQGATAKINILSVASETMSNMNITPAPVIPDAMNDNPLVYDKDASVYSKNAFFPSEPAKLFPQTKMRGVDVVMLGMSPFQYNPVTKELVAYKEIKVEITFEGGNGHFGDDSYRSRYWEPILSDMILNYNQLPEIDFNAQIRKHDNMKITADTGYEYAIIIPTNPEFKQWADSIRKFRAEQGILTGIFTLAQIGTQETDIQTWVQDAYTNWDIKPAAILCLGDYGTTAASTVVAHKYQHLSSSFPDYASDNFYADVTGDDLPDIVFSRIVANTAAQLQVLCSKFLNYERNPPTDPNFYAKPLQAMGWQDDRWFQLCAETCTGFLKTLGKTPTRVNALGSPAQNSGSGPNTGIWSTNSNTTTVVNFFGASGLNYIPDQPGTTGGFSGGNATLVNSAINAGTFLVLHRDHGYYQGWGDPAYSNTSVSSLTNVGNKLPFVFSVNCQTGAFHYTSESFVEKMHRYTKNGQNSGALGMIGDAETSYSFVNDCMVWGMWDNMWPQFMPAYGNNPAGWERDKRPAFACASAKYFLQQSSWASSGTKQITYRLYHMFGDAFQWFYTVVPQNLYVSHDPVISPLDNSFNVTATAGSFISLTVPGPNGPIILGTAAGTGSSVAIPLSQPVTSGSMLVTVTKQDYLRYSALVSSGNTTSVNDNKLSGNLDMSCYPNPASGSTTVSYLLAETGNVTLTVVDQLGKEIKVLVNGQQKPAGTYQMELNTHDLTKGVYSLVLKTDLQVVTQSLGVK